MIASSGFGFLALFSILATLIGGDRRPNTDADPYRMDSRWIRWIR